MAGSTGPNARMEKLTSNLNEPCPDGQVRNKATGACEPAKPMAQAEVTTTDDPNALKKDELSNFEKKHGKLSKEDKIIADRLSELSVRRLQQNENKKNN
jgi:hypothetical protein